MVRSASDRPGRTNGRRYVVCTKRMHFQAEGLGSMFNGVAPKRGSGAHGALCAMRKAASPSAEVQSPIELSPLRLPAMASDDAAPSSTPSASAGSASASSLPRGSYQALTCAPEPDAAE